MPELFRQTIVIVPQQGAYLNSSSCYFITFYKYLTFYKYCITIKNSNKIKVNISLNKNISNKQINKL